MLDRNLDDKLASALERDAEGRRTGLRGGTVNEVESINPCYWSDVEDRGGLRESAKFLVRMDSSAIHLDSVQGRE